MATCENCGRTCDKADDIKDPFRVFCSKECENEFYEKWKERLNHFCKDEQVESRRKDENVEHPSRYNKCGIEVWDVEKAFATTKWSPFVEHLRLGAVEYLLRAPDKNGVEDIRKAMFLLDRIVKEMEAK